MPNNIVCKFTLHTHTHKIQVGHTSNRVCAENYGGPSVHSEPETQNVIDYFRSHAPIIGAIDWHSHGQLVLRPWGWSSKSVKDEERLKQLGHEMAEKMYQVSNWLCSNI